MNTRALNHRLKGYVTPTLRAGNEDGAVVDVIDDLQSITDEDDHHVDTAHDTDNIVDSLHLPNSAIIEEMMVELIPKAEVTNHDTAVKLLSDSTEAMRRLETIQMNVNYPVSGYRVSSATALKTDPALESLVALPAPTRTQLNVAIEAGKFKIIKAAYAAFIRFIKEQFDKAMAFLARFKKTDKKKISGNINEVREAIKENKEATITPKKAQTMQKMIPVLLGQVKDTSGESSTIPIITGIDAYVSEVEWKRATSASRGALANPDTIKELINEANTLGKVLDDRFIRIGQFIEQFVKIMRNGKGEFEEDLAKFKDLEKDIQAIQPSQQDTRSNWVEKYRNLQRDAQNKLNSPLKGTAFLESSAVVISHFDNFSVASYTLGQSETNKALALIGEFIRKMETDDTPPPHVHGKMLSIMKELQSEISDIAIAYSLVGGFSQIRLQLAIHIENITKFVANFKD